MQINKEAISWWNSMNFEEQFFKTIEWLKLLGLDTTSKHPHTLGFSEIYQMFRYWNYGLTKVEANDLMGKGVKLTHRYFGAHEWVTMEGINIVTEDNVYIPKEEFWGIRNVSSFENGWALFSK